MESHNNNSNALNSFTDLLISICDVYKYIEPDLFSGRVTVIINVDDMINPIAQPPHGCLIDLFDLINESRSDIILRVKKNDTFKYEIWKNLVVNLADISNGCIVYSCCQGKETFHSNRQLIPIKKMSESASNYAPHFSSLKNALLEYKATKIRNSSCTIFDKTWADEKRIFFNPLPEEYMQKSLHAFLSSRFDIKGTVEILRELNTDETNPVDIRLLWKLDHRAALIEIKWLGKSRNSRKKITTQFSNSRAVDGLVQLVRYHNKYKKTCPTDKVKSYLVVIDARRRRTKSNTSNIDMKDGHHFSEKELVFPANKQFYNMRNDIECPIRMFSEPLCN